VSILVCYLAAPGEKYIEAAHRFDESYRFFEPGIDHDLLFISKVDSSIGSQATFYDTYPWPTNAWVEPHSNVGFDIRSLQRVCRDRADQYDRICWLGSNSCILSHHWLKKLWDAATQPAAVAVAATGSYESGVSRQRPNPHLRTNCLMVIPQVLNDLGFGPADTRMDCYEFEHGIHSFTARLRRIGYRPLVVGADGCWFDVSEWPESKTFRTSKQENLLVSDRQTDAYMAASPEEQVALEKLAWSL